MTDEKKPPAMAAHAGGLRWAVGRCPAGSVELTVYAPAGAAAISLGAAEAAMMARALLADDGGDADALATARLLAASACQIVTHCHDGLRPGEL